MESRQAIETIPLDTLNRALARAVASVPAKIFLDFSGETYSFAEVDRLAAELACGLLELGVKPGDRVVSMLDNNIDAVTVWLAILKISAISVPMNTAFKGVFLCDQLNDCGARILIAEPEYAQRVALIADSITDLKVFVSRGGGAVVSGLPTDMTLDSLRAKHIRPIPDQTEPAKTAILAYTSGTTGAPKGCLLPHNAICHIGWTWSRTGIDSNDVYSTSLPLFHLAAIGIVTACLIAQCTASIAGRFSVSGFWPEIRRSGATITMVLGSMLPLIAEAPDNESSLHCYGQLRKVQAPVTALSTILKWKERFGVMNFGANSYGMTEACTISGLLPGELPGPAGSAGRAGVDFDIIIADDADTAQPSGNVGEILIRPKHPFTMFEGYWNKPAETVNAWRNLWFHTGDIGKLDAEGYLYFVDRKKDSIRRRGENISSQQLEAVFKEHRAIRDVAVHAVPSPFGEDEVKVTAELNSETLITEEELCRWSLDLLPYFAVPRYIEFREDMPRTATGKIQKEQLRQEGKTASTWDREAAGVIFQRR